MEENKNFVKLFLNEGIYVLDEQMPMLAKNTEEAPDAKQSKRDTPAIEAQPKPEPDEKIAPPLPKPEIEPVIAKEPETSLQQPVPSPQNEAVPEATIDFYGQNRKGILILTDYSDEKHLSIGDSEFLKKILQAVNLTFDDIALVNIARHNTPAQLNKVNQFGAKTVIAFGIKNESLGAVHQTTHYELVDQGEMHVLCADALSTIATDNDKKRKLWTNLKQMFL